MPTSETGSQTPRSALNLYETDFYAWTQTQAALLRSQQWRDLDLPNLIEEIESLGEQQRREILQLLADNPSLKPYLDDALALAYANGRDLAMAETDLPESTFPADCPYQQAEIFGDRFFPGVPLADLT